MKQCLIEGVAFPLFIEPSDAYHMRQELVLSCREKLKCQCPLLPGMMVLKGENEVKVPILALGFPGRSPACQNFEEDWIK